METNDPPCKNIIQHVKSMITESNFNLTVYELYLSQIKLDMTGILKAYESSIDVSEKMDSELTRFRLCFEDFKLKIESLESEFVKAKHECIILNEKCDISVSERNLVVNNNICLNASIDSLHNSIDMIELNRRMTHTLFHPLSTAPGLENEFPKRIPSPLKELQNLNFMGDILNHIYSDTLAS